MSAITNTLRAALVALLICLAAALPARSQDWQQQVRTLVGEGAVLVADGSGQPLLEINSTKRLIPASTLKVVTSAAALDILGPDYRFVTEFRLSQENDLYIVGRGDPFLVSEEVQFIAQALKQKGLTSVRNIYLDNSFFTPDLVLHGTGRSLNPYDAYNGALCVNFNTIYVRVEPGGQVTSAESQTPLTPMALAMARKNKTKGRIRFNLAEHPQTCLLYAGDLFKTFLQQAGVDAQGEVGPARTNSQAIPLFYRHLARENLAGLVARLFKYSNNFMTNQIFLTMGAEKYGPPATVEKSRRTVSDFLERHALPDLTLEEGSGLSRRTTVTAREMTSVLRYFAPLKDLLPGQGRALYKTGSLNDVNAMIGYLVPDQGEALTFVIILNGSQFAHNSRDRILALLEENLL
jgi:D-alanyl-D-alanine carboxypeptidase/D-alanyl-D-alanine-endopeptidase (penicillin-binding protein 4)